MKRRAGSYRPVPNDSAGGNRPYSRNLLWLIDLTSC
jgi:hypothetical protein